jgi:hypothetical protein
MKSADEPMKTHAATAKAWSGKVGGTCDVDCDVHVLQGDTM